MPPTAANLRAGRYFLSLVVILGVLYGLVFLPGARHTPKLGLDLEGGQQIVLLAKKPGGGTPTQQSMTVARQILTDRVNGKGVAAPDIVQEGNDRINISIPGSNTKDLSNIQQTAQLNFRPLVMPPVPITQSSTTATAASSPVGSAGSTSPSGGSVTGTPANTTAPGASPAPTSATPKAATAPGSSAPAVGNLLDPTRAAALATTPAMTATAPTSAGAPISSPAMTAAAPTGTPATPSPAAPSTSPALPELQNPFTGLTFPLPTTDVQFAALSAAQQAQLTAALNRFNCGSKPPDDATKPYAACSPSEGLKYLLGPVIIRGTDIKTASAQAPSGTSAQYTVSLTLKDAGDKAWADYTKKHHSDTGGTIPSNTACSTTTTPCAEYVAFTLDGNVVSDPHNEATIAGMPTQISGGFTQQSSTELANLLKYGALPLDLSLLTSQHVSATLGSSQLQAGLLAGGIGLALVVLYSLLYYRGLGLVTIASLLVSGALTYACLVVLGREIGFTLTLAGIAGFIVAVGITADSFVVLFERLKDEVHSGRSIRVAVPRAWTRARRTILSADTVSFLAAAVLYYFAAGDVRGFAFTLGLSTVLDLVVVFLFTHPLISVLARSRTFGSPRFTGLNSVRAGGIASDLTSTRRTRPVDGGGRRGRRSSGATSIALLEPDVLTDADADAGYDDRDADPTGTGVVERDTDDRVDGPESLPVVRGKRSSRMPQPAALGADAAQRAAARRGRSVRAPVVPAADDADDIEAAAHDAAATDVDDAHADDARELSAASAAAQPAVAAEPVVAEPVASEAVAAGPVESPEVSDQARPSASRSASRVGSAAAERAASRRGRIRSRSGQPVDPAQPIDTTQPREDQS